MPYFATYTGDIIAKTEKVPVLPNTGEYLKGCNKNPLMTVEEVLNYGRLNIADKYNVSDNNGISIHIELSGDGNFDEDCTEEALTALAPIVTFGEVFYHGEGDDFWAYIFTEGEWETRYGALTYEKESFTKEDVTEVLSKLIGAPEEASGITVFLPDVGIFYNMELGSGENLLPEDYESGADSYVEIQGYKLVGNEYTYADADGGEFAFHSSKSQRNDIREYVYDCLKMVSRDNKCPKFIPISAY